MRRKDREITDKNIIDEILRKSEICRVAFFDDEFPYVVPLNYGYSQNALYFHTATKGKKLNLIAKNNKVAFVIEYFSEILKYQQSCDWTTRYRSLMGVGTIEVITDFEVKKKGLDILMTHYGKTDNIYVDKHVNNIVILKLTISDLSAKQAGDWE